MTTLAERDTTPSSAGAESARRSFRILSFYPLGAMVLPIFSGYGSSLVLMVWLSFHRLWPVVLGRKPANGEVSDPAVLARVQRMRHAMRPIHWGVLAYVVAMVAAAILSASTSDWAGSSREVTRELKHFILKSGILWFALSGAILGAIASGWRVRDSAKIWLGLLTINFIYMVVQRYTGINWSAGFGEVLGPHRFAYGVYRVSGFMGHPLSLSYNLVLITVIVAGFCLRGGVQKSVEGIRVWVALLCVALASLFVTGSRWPLVAAIIAVAAPELTRIWKWRWHVAGLTVGFGVLLYFEGSILGRMSEIMAPGQTFAQRFDRIVFWQAHWRMFLDHPLFGVGIAAPEAAKVHYYNLVGGSDKLYQAHNIFLQTLADSGIVGFAGLAALVLGFLVATLRSFGASGARGMLMLLAAILLCGLLQNNLRDSEFLFALWLGTCLVLARDSEDLKTEV